LQSTFSNSFLVAVDTFNGVSKLSPYPPFVPDSAVLKNA
jgi:hypothetical protein